MNKSLVVKIYEPHEDWAGMGYKHWMVVLVGAFSSKSGSPTSGVGHTLQEAYEDLRKHMK